MERKELKVAILRKMNNLENDDRIRKEFASLSKLFPHVAFKCFVMYPDNKEYEGVTSYGLPYKAVHVKGRDRYESGKHLIAKSWDYYKAIRRDIKDYDVIWCSGDSPTPTLLFIRHKKIVWDLRELPLFLVGSRIKHIILKHIFSKCDICLHTNQYRIDYLNSLGLIKNPSKHIPIRNYPEFSTFDEDYDELYKKTKEWIAGRNCVYIQGINNASRASKEVLSAIMETPDICSIILGQVDAEAKSFVEKKYGEENISSNLFCVGTVPVLKVPQYMKLCCASMIFYKNTSPNNWYCEANRLYQAIDMGLPVVVGSNPAMKSTVEEYGVGISVDTDGSDENMIKDGLSKLLSQLSLYQDNISKLKDEIHWNSQDTLLYECFGKLFK